MVLQYTSVGKGRDMGFDSINAFEAKVREGEGLQGRALAGISLLQPVSWRSETL